MKSSLVLTFCIIAFVGGALGNLLGIIIFFAERRGEGLTPIMILGSDLIICASIIALAIATRANKE